jgi:hypothetical protein
VAADAQCGDQASASVFRSSRNFLDTPLRA